MNENENSKINLYLIDRNFFFTSIFDLIYLKEKRSCNLSG